MKTSEEESRKAFENWTLAHNEGWGHLVCQRDSDGNYKVMSTLQHWQAWEACNSWRNEQP